MKFIESGEGKVPLLSAIAILAISLTVNLPGLAISPVLGELRKVMHSTALEVQLLNVLPNLVTIPFILCAGKICTPKNQLTVLTTGLIIFTAVGVAYFFAKTMIVLIILSCLLGVGCGLVIPLAASLISQNFSGRPRSTLLGTKSGLSNFSVIIATLFVGWVATANWHYAFIVYFIPLIPLCLVPFIRNKFINQNRKAPSISQENSDDKVSFHFKGKKAIRMMWGAITIYFIATYATMAISYYLPFTMEHYGLSTGKVGVATAMYYLAATLAGFGLSRMIKLTGVWTLQLGLVLASIGLLGVGFIHEYAWYIIGILVMGFGYGLVQPILYDKTSYFAPSDAKSTQYFAYLLTFNYIGISSVPFIVEFFRTFIKDPNPASHDFSYIIAGIILGIVAIVTIVMHKSFVVQAGVIPEEGGFIEEPSSVLAPGDRVVSSEDHSDEDINIVEPMNTIKETDISKTPADATSATNSLSSRIAQSSAATLKDAEKSLDDARSSMQDFRLEEAATMRKEAEILSEKADELNKEAQNLLNEANALENDNEDDGAVPDGQATPPDQPK